MEKPNRTQILIALLFVATIAVAGIAVHMFSHAPAFVYAGTLEATKIDIPSRITSVIIAQTANEGDRIKIGQPLLSMSCEDYLLAANLAKTNYGRGEKMYVLGAMSQLDRDLLKNKKENADLNVSWCSVVAPTNGAVLTRYREAGEMVTPGTKLFTVADVKDLYAYIYVPQPLIANLAVGETVDARLPETQDESFEGRITWISEEAEFTPKNVQTRQERERLVFAVKISFLGDGYTLKPGMTAEITLRDQGAP